MNTILATTLVGSYPQPDWLIDRAKLAGRFPPRDDKIRVNSSSLDHPLVILPDPSARNRSERKNHHRDPDCAKRLAGLSIIPRGWSKRARGPLVFLAITARGVIKMSRISDIPRLALGARGPRPWWGRPPATSIADAQPCISPSPRLWSCVDVWGPGASATKGWCASRSYLHWPRVVLCNSLSPLRDLLRRPTRRRNPLANLRRLRQDKGGGMNGKKTHTTHPGRHPVPSAS